MRQNTYIQTTLAAVASLTLATVVSMTTGQTARADDTDFEYTSYTFGDDLVGGERVVPMGEVLHGRGGLGRESLVRVRRNFVPELLKSVECL